MHVRITRDLLALVERHRIRSAQVGQRWRVGDVLMVHPTAAIEPYCLLAEGKVIPGAMMSFSYTNSACDVGMRIGRYCSIAEGVNAMGPPHPTDWVSTSPFSYFSNPRRPFAEFFADRKLVEPELLNFDHGSRRVVIGHDVWIGARATIKYGVEIGHGAVVGGSSVVTRNVPPYAIVAGVPARIIRYRLPERVVPRLLKLGWWRFTPEQLRPLDIQNPERFADQLEERIANGMKPPRARMLTAKMLAEAGEVLG